MSQHNLFGFNPDQIGGKVGANPPETSQRAAIRVKSGSQKAQVILALSSLYPHDGMTAYGLDGFITNAAGDPISRNQIATRLGELRDQGLAMYLFDQFGKPVERETTPGNTGYVHVLTRQGMEVAYDLRRRGVST